MFYGEYRHQLDEKGRFRIPAKLKSGLHKICADYVITKGRNGCLYIMPESEAENMIKQDAVHTDKFKLERYYREIYSSYTPSAEDNQGRMLLPQNLKSHAGISKNIVTIGTGDRIELWSEEKWDSYTTKNAEEWDDLLKDLESGENN